MPLRRSPDSQDCLPPADGTKREKRSIHLLPIPVIFSRYLQTSAEMTALYARWLDAYPIVSLEDGLGDDDCAGFQAHTAALGNRVQIVGDDIFVTNTRFIGRGIQERSANAALIKLNQIGTVTETVEAIDMCRKAGWNYVMSHRSGETEDPFIADFTVAMGGGQIKTGSLCRSERIAKYNRLLEIQRELGSQAMFFSPFASGHS